MTALSKALRPRAVTAADVRRNRNETEDSYIAKLVKYIPGEIVALFTFASGLILGAKDIPTATVLWIVIGVLTVMTPIWLLFSTKIENKPLAIYQAVAGTVAFLVWAYYLDGATLVSWYHPVYGALALAFVTVIIPWLEKIFAK